MPRHPQCAECGPDSAHTFVVFEGAGPDSDWSTLDTVRFTQHFCPGEPPPAAPLHGHGGQPNPGGCWQC